MQNGDNRQPQLAPKRARMWHGLLRQLLQPKRFKEAGNGGKLLSPLLSQIKISKQETVSDAGKFFTGLSPQPKVMREAGNSGKFFRRLA